MTTWQKQYRNHETRMWITGVLLPIAAIVASNEDLRNGINNSVSKIYNSGKERVKKIYHKLFKK